MSKDRVETFSDGVFAIILTLLVLELLVPNIADHSSLSQYAAATAPLIPKVISFVLTFYAFRHYAIHAKLFKEDEIAKAQGPRRSIPAITLYTLSILFSFVNV